MSSDKKCKEGKEINPFTGNCYPKCIDGKIRFIDIENKKFSCKTPVNLEKEVFELEMAELELIKRGLMKEKSSTASETKPVSSGPTPNQNVDKNIRDCPPRCSKGYSCDKKTGKCNSTAVASNTVPAAPVPAAPVPAGL